MISLIVPTYKQLGFLELVLQGIKKQSYSDFELIIAEDDNAAETVDFLQKARAACTFPIKHVSQVDNGFRKTKILNAAVRVAQGEQLVFIDGDCIPHKHFLKQYHKMIKGNAICYGRRGYLSKKFTEHLLKTKTIQSLRFLNILFTGGKSMGAILYTPFLPARSKQHRDILGCNWGVLRTHLLRINGFDEDYVRAGAGEDLDVTWRLKGSGLRMKSVKNKAIVYHLYHAANYNDEDLKAVNTILKEKTKAGHIQCLNGINQQ